MCFFFSLIPATLWLIVGYFVLFASTKSDGGVRTYGRIPAIWTFIIAVSIPLVALYVSVSGMCPMETMMQTMRNQS